MKKISRGQLAHIYRDSRRGEKNVWVEHFFLCTSSQEEKANFAYDILSVSYPEEKWKMYRSMSVILGQYSYMISSDDRYYTIYVTDGKGREIVPYGMSWKRVL